MAAKYLGEGQYQTRVTAERAGVDSAMERYVAVAVPEGHTAYIVGTAVPVVDPEDGRAAVAGIFSERDVTYCLAREGAAALNRPLAEVMTTPVQTVAPADAVIAALSLMTRRRIRHLPVVEAGTIVGIVSIGDLVKYRIDRIEAEARAMRDYIQQA